MTPLFASEEHLKQTSPCFVSYCAYDVCASGAELYARRLQSAGKLAGKEVIHSSTK